ncbi:dolichol-phosphate mannosyltransferase subunit 3 [Biomphalaria glabrata]|uniref:Dolichol-phosphate mannosyltransferase subunit 3 n=1 Tax=Biomphalaria glabrata TaxID=6526 RepID=A0A2C9LNF1_BIOGL|nr:dolichol-phosphate mannosyltransferase subunit 3-like [Biomphalaria glabrata]KAI8739454.1 dolichol-phosphate mannosyltransferase subunit 3-like [Biomphalaria glabrata]KAI8771711.1 dolichol-phosphate mannosyltransferase subunit 3 [Biomphalaria glabrata]
MAVSKLFQWLICLTSFLAVWLSYVLGLVQTKFSEEMNEIIIALPIYLLILFACVLLGMIGHRVATFNDCELASKELKEHIDAARQDLAKKGYKFASDWKS